MTINIPKEDQIFHEIDREYPPERLHFEMTLVRLLNDRRSWADYKDIIGALNNIRMHAEDMERERRMFMDADANEPQQG